MDTLWKMNLADLHRSHDQAHASYHGIDSFQTRMVRSVVQTRLGPAPRQRVLDVGCADGYLLGPFAREHDLIGVDVSTQFAGAALKAGFASHQCKDLSSDRIELDDKSIDLAFCGQTIEHVIDTDWLLCEINRVLKPGASLIVTTPNVRSPHSLLRWLLNEPPAFGSKYRSGHVRDWTTRLLRRALENNGFQVQLVQGVEFWLPGGSDILSPLFRPFPSLATAMLACAVKTQDVAYTVRPFEN
jgi:2-polyprenyl-3-methyl-5-hydroxy-6-metoxy-1,4-benzoquinol methylase